MSQLDSKGQTVLVEFSEGHPKPVIIDNTFRAKFVNIVRYEWTNDELRLYAPLDTVIIPRLSVAYILVQQPNKEQVDD